MRNTRFLFIGLLAGMLCLQSVASFATVVYNNGSPNQLSGNEMTTWIQAEDFTLGATTKITDIRFWNIQYASTGAYNGSITWQFYSNTGGAPGTLITSGNTTAVTRTAGAVTPFVEFQNDFSIGSVTLGPGTYWLGLHNGPLTHTPRDDFYWETTASNLTSTGREDITPFGTGGWGNNGTEHAFVLYDNTQTAVPEPSTLVLFGAGLAGAALIRRKARKN